MSEGRLTQLEEDPLPVSHQRKPKTPVRKHGTIYAYKRQLCRCDECRAANAAYSVATTNHDRHREANRRWYAEKGKAARHAD